MIDNFNIGKRLSFTKADLMCDTTKKEPNTTQNQLEQATENAAPDQFVNSNKNSNNKPDVKISYNLSEIKKFGFSDTEIEKYFNYFESKTPDGQILKGYGLKQGVVINGKTVTSLEELVDALGKNDTTKMAYSESDLFRYGFTNEEKNKYFNSFDSLTKGKKAYGLKEGIFINGKHISDLKELADALGKTDITLFTNYKRPPIFNPLNFSTKLDSSRPKEADSNKEQTFNTKISYNLSEIKKFGFSDTEIEKYFNYFESKTPDGQILKGYGLKQGVVINGKTVTSLEELVDALGKNDTTKMAYSESDLFRYGFTNEEKNKYFNSFDSLTKGKKAYGLKEGIFINDKHISDLKELADALGKTDITKFNY